MASGRTLRDLGLDGGAVVVTAIRREGIVGRDPDPTTLLREGDVLVLFGTAEDLERAGVPPADGLSRQAHGRRCLPARIALRRRTCAWGAPRSSSAGSRPRRSIVEQHARPLLLEKALALVAHELCAASRCDEHAAAAALLDQALVDELLIALEHGQRVQRELGGDTADRRQCVTLGELSLQDHRHDLVAQLAIDGLAVVPVGSMRPGSRRGAALLYCSRTPRTRLPGDVVDGRSTRRLASHADVGDWPWAPATPDATAYPANSQTTTGQCGGREPVAERIVVPSICAITYWCCS